MKAVIFRQIVAQDNSTSRTIMWQSDNSEADAVIEYRLEGAEKSRTIGATDKAFTDDGSTTYIHEATLTGLTPNTKYEYRVGYGADRRSDWYRLETAGASVYDVLIYPDSQSGGLFSVGRDCKELSTTQPKDRSVY